MDKTRIQHLNDQDVEGYVEYLLREISGMPSFVNPSISEIEGHLCVCDSCAERVDRIYRECLFFHDWTFARDNEQIMLQKTTQAIQRIAKESFASAIRARLVRWEKAILDTPRNLSRVMLTLSDQIQQKASGFIHSQGILPTPSEWKFDFATQWVPTRNGEKRLEPDYQLIEAHHSSLPFGFHAKIIDEEKTICLEFEPGVPPEQIPLVMLVSPDSDPSPVMGNLVFRQDKDRHQIWFSDLPTGRYVLVIEP